MGKAKTPQTSIETAMQQGGAPSAPEAPGAERKIPLIVKVYGFLCMADGIVTVPMVFLFLGILWWAMSARPDLVSIGSDPTLPVILMAVSIVVSLGNGIALIIFGHSLLKNRRRNAARWSHALIATTLVQIILRIMLQGIDTNLIADAIQLVIVLTLSVTVDPQLRHERHMKQVMRDLTETSSTCSGSLPSAACSASLSRPSTTWSWSIRASTRTARACSLARSRPSMALAPCS